MCLKRIQEHNQVIVKVRRKMIFAIIGFCSFLLLGILGLIINFIFVPFYFYYTFFICFLIIGCGVSIIIFNNNEAELKRNVEYQNLYTKICAYISVSMSQGNISPFVLDQALVIYNYLENRSIKQDLLVESYEQNLQSSTTNNI